MIKQLLLHLTSRQDKTEARLEDLAEGVTGDIVSLMDRTDQLVDALLETHRVLEAQRAELERECAALSKMLEGLSEQMTDLQTSLTEQRVQGSLLA
ncbi:hypothetical protein [Deinococcus sp. Leaf326]|uniref:hypothetical protein n=1 Tax=Deinococcus sp. Leaf326 TaxID=1736338 RepID=UPI000A4E257A|nr:hypothetical protein [Deinococcus sp. Leaf326]